MSSVLPVGPPLAATTSDAGSTHVWIDCGAAWAVTRTPALPLFVPNDRPRVMPSAEPNVGVLPTTVHAPRAVVVTPMLSSTAVVASPVKAGTSHHDPAARADAFACSVHRSMKTVPARSLRASTHETVTVPPATPLPGHCGSRALTLPTNTQSVVAPWVTLMRTRVP